MSSLELEEGWCDRIAKLVESDYRGPSESELRNRLRKLGIAYAETGMSDTQFRYRKAELEAQIKAASNVVPPSYEEAAALLSNLSELWKEATPKERRKLVSPLIERVYVDMELKLVGAITPTPAFRALLKCAVQKSDSPVWVGSQDEMESLGVWSWWRRGRIRLPQLQSREIIVPHSLQPHWGAFGVGWVA